RRTGEPDLEALQRHAVDDVSWFWGAAVDDLGLAWQRRPRQVVDLSQGPEWSRWWIGGMFNYASAAVDSRAERDPEGLSLAWEGEDGEIRRLTNSGLREAVDAAAAMLAAEGIDQGDRVG